MTFFANTFGILLFALLMGGSVYLGLRIVFRAQDSPRTRRVIVLVASSTVLLGYIGFAVNRISDVEEEPEYLSGVLTLESDVALTVSVQVAEWQRAFDEFELIWPESGQLVPGEDQGTLGTITGTYVGEGQTIEASIGIGGSGITGFKCAVQGFRDQAATVEFFETCWEAAKVSRADGEAGSAWVADTVAALSQPQAEITQATEQVCPAELTMLSIGGSDSYDTSDYRWLTFNILPSQTVC